MDITLLIFLKHHVHAKLEICINQIWLLTGIYGHSKVAKRREVWNLIKNLKPERQAPWLLCGDFNEILSNNEKASGQLQTKNKMAQFRSMLDYYMLNVTPSSLESKMSHT